MVVVYQVRKGNKILGEYNNKAEAGRALSRFLYSNNNLSLVTVIKKRK